MLQIICDNMLQLGCYNMLQNTKRYDILQSDVGGPIGGHDVVGVPPPLLRTVLTIAAISPAYQSGRNDRLRS
jgi:hypothetical protein